MNTKNVSQIKIEKNVPMDSKSAYVQAFKQMQKGDSFFVTPKIMGIKILNQIKSYIGHYKTGTSVASRSEGDGLRIWKTK